MKWHLVINVEYKLLATCLGQKNNEYIIKRPVNIKVKFI